MHPVKKEGVEGCDIRINIQSYLRDFFEGYIPPNNLAEFKVKAYCPQNHYISNYCYKEVPGAVYYKSGALHIVPDNDPYRWFYSIGDELNESDRTDIYPDLEAHEIGLIEDLMINFEILSDEPEYVSYNKGVDKDLDYYELPMDKEDDIMATVFCSAWNILSNDPNYVDTESVQHPVTLRRWRNQEISYFSLKLNSITKKSKWMDKGGGIMIKIEEKKLREIILSDLAEKSFILGNTTVITDTPNGLQSIKGVVYHDPTLNGFLILAYDNEKSNGQRAIFGNINGDEIGIKNNVEIEIKINMLADFATKPALSQTREDVAELTGKEFN